MKKQEQETEKLIEFALNNAPSFNKQGLLNVIMGSANPIVACEMVTGIYDRPIIPLTPKDINKLYISSKAFNISYLSYNDLTQNVSFSYNKYDSNGEPILADDQTYKIFTDECQLYKWI